jgi:hypothetical protein
MMPFKSHCTKHARVPIQLHGHTGPVNQVKGADSACRCVRWQVASSGRDGLIQLGDSREDANSAGLATLHGHKGPVNQVRHANY